MKIFQLTFLLLIFSYSVTFANDIDNKFIIKDIKVDKIANNAEEARRQAIEYAQKHAFEQILKNLLNIVTTENDIPFEKISNLVQTIEFREEVITDRKYQAVIDVSFQPEQTRFLINNYFLNKSTKKTYFINSII